jgi:hypothetical protein
MPSAIQPKNPLYSNTAARRVYGFIATVEAGPLQSVIGTDLQPASAVPFTPSDLQLHLRGATSKLIASLAAPLVES